MGNVSDENNMQKILNEIVQTTKRLGLKISPTKSKILTRGNGSTNLKLKLDGEPLDIVDSYKYLGIVLDKNLSFTKHVDYITKSARKKMFSLKWILNKTSGMSAGTQILAYKSFVRPIL